MRRKKRDDLLNAGDLAQNRSGEPTPQETLDAMQRRCRVLEHSINAQMGVVDAFEQGSPEYATAVQIVTAMQDNFFELKLDTSVLRLRLLLGDDPLKTANVLENFCNTVEEQTKNPQRGMGMSDDRVPQDDIVDAQYATSPQAQDAVPSLVEPSGTEVASDLQQTTDDLEPVGDIKLPEDAPEN